MPIPDLHPSRLPAVAAARQQLRCMQKAKPHEFTAENAERLDDLTDQLLLSMAHQLARLERELRAATSARGRIY